MAATVQSTAAILPAAVVACCSRNSSGNVPRSTPEALMACHAR
jgi:hypothetical protein